LFVYCPLSIQAADDNLFIDRFQGRGENWKISQTAGDGPSIERKEGGDRRGLHFVTNGLAVASAPWRVGTEPFELSEPEAVQQDGLVIGGTGDATAADFDLLLTGGEDDVDQADFAQFVEKSTGFVAQAGRLDHLASVFQST
jgi:hypothetical protein